MTVLLTQRQKQDRVVIAPLVRGTVDVDVSVAVVTEHKWTRVLHRPDPLLHPGNRTDRVQGCCMNLCTVFNTLKRNAYVLVLVSSGVALVNVTPVILLFSYATHVLYSNNGSRFNIWISGSLISDRGGQKWLLKVMLPPRVCGGICVRLSFVVSSQL